MVTSFALWPWLKRLFARRCNRRKEKVMTRVYPRDLVERLEPSWKPPWELRFSVDGPVPPEAATPLPTSTLRDVLEVVFFASLQTDEGEFLESSIVLAPNASVLGQMGHGSWNHEVAFGQPATLDVPIMAKLARTVSGSTRSLVVSFDSSQPKLVGLATAPTGVFLSPDHYPRIRAVGPGDLVFFRGPKPLFRYRHGTTTDLTGDFFTDDVCPEARRALATQISALQDTPPYQDALASSVTLILERIVRNRHGGLLAVLAPNEAPTAHSPDFQTRAFSFGMAALAAFDKALASERADGEAILRKNASDAAALTLELEAQRAHRETEAAAETVAGMASVDGAVLLSASLDVLGFGYKLPRPGSAQRVIWAHNAGSVAEVEYDLTRKGTRHAAAVSFAAACPGRFCFVVSSDGPISCFWCPRREEPVYYWPAYTGALRSIF